MVRALLDDCGTATGAHPQVCRAILLQTRAVLSMVVDMVMIIDLVMVIDMQEGECLHTSRLKVDAHV